MAGSTEVAAIVLDSAAFFSKSESQVDMDSARSKRTEWRAVISGDENDAVPRKVARMSVDRDSEYYNMNHKRRGMAIIFNHKYFDDIYLKHRVGTNVDSDNLKKTMERLGFEVKLHDDLTHDELMKMVDEAARDDHSESDCFVMAVLSHGKEGEIHSRDKSYKIESLWSPFTCDKCPTLAGKPKLFFIQACRGDKRDKGIKLQPRIECDSIDMGYAIPITADFLVCYSTVPGYVSYRDTINGTWFVQALCSELKKKGTSKDLCEILTCVQKRVALHFEADKNKQMPCFTSMLTRLLIFTSKEVNKMEVNKMPDLLLSQDKSGQTAWHNAAEGGHVELLDKLWDWDKALQLKPEELRNGLLLSKGAFEQTAWHKAVIRGHVEILEKLWARGAVI